MLNDPSYIAIGFACVVALLLGSVFIIYCIKRQKYTDHARQWQEERQRRGRHMRHLMRAQVVRPPPYDPQRVQRDTLYGHVSIPMSPPPEYKLIATPLPPRDIHVIGITGMEHPPPSYEDIPTVSGIVASTAIAHNYRNNYNIHPYSVTNSPHSPTPGGPRPSRNRPDSRSNSSLILVASAGEHISNQATLRPTHHNDLSRQDVRLMTDTQNRPNQETISISRTEGIDSLRQDARPSRGNISANQNTERYNYYAQGSQSQDLYRTTINRGYEPSYGSRASEFDAHGRDDFSQRHDTQDLSLI